jgi:hypothetical protein
MKKIWLVVLAVALLGCSSGGTLSAQENTDGGEEAVVFYGVVTDEVTGEVISGATVEVWCDSCSWHKVTTTDEYGIYVFEGESHIGHSGSIAAGTPWPGYLGYIKPYESLTSFSNRVDFALPRAE